jgi:DNA-binding response OmpR family regulator
MSKKILIIDESNLFRDYLSKKLNQYGFEVLEGHNGLDGSAKMRGEMPDLVIMDYYLSRKSSMEVLQEKVKNPNTKDTPVILVSTKIDKNKVIEIAKFGVKKFFSKPLKMDALLSTVSEVLKVELKLDTTPCIIEAHFNDDILFIEVARGLNTEKIELLRYKLTELLGLYKVKVPKVLVMMSNLELTPADVPKLQQLFEEIIENGRTRPKLVKVLTTSDFVKDFLSESTDFFEIGVAESLDKAMDDLIGLKPDQIAHDEVAHSKFLTATAPKDGAEENFALRFDAERDGAAGDGGEALASQFGEATIAVVDDDLVIRELVKTVFSETGWTVVTFENGKEFVKGLNEHEFDLAFLDLMMPEMNGFQVLQYMKHTGNSLPIIVFSALTHQETVVKAVNFGISSYLIKPLKPEKLLRKAIEILSVTFK